MCLGPLPAGTQVAPVETVRALAERPEVYEVLVYTPVEVPDYARSAFEGYAKITVRRMPNLKPQRRRRRTWSSGRTRCATPTSSNGCAVSASGSWSTNST